VKQEDSSGALGQQEGHQRQVRLGRITFAAGEYEIVRPIVCRLAAAGSNMIQGDLLFGNFFATVSAD